MSKPMEYYLTKRYEVTTHNIALIDHKNVDIVGIPLTEIDGEVHENHNVTILTKFTIDKIIRTFKFNIPISIRKKSLLTEFLNDMEELINILSNKKSRNQLNHIITLPNNEDITLDDVITFYNTLVFNNKKVVEKQFTKLVEDDFEILPKELREERNININVGNKFTGELRKNVDFSSSRVKPNIKGNIRDEY